MEPIGKYLVLVLSYKHASDEFRFVIDPGATSPRSDDTDDESDFLGTVTVVNDEYVVLHQHERLVEKSRRLRRSVRA